MKIVIRYHLFQVDSFLRISSCCKKMTGKLLLRTIPGGIKERFLFNLCLYCPVKVLGYD